jgi:glycolate oxidase FAD binding subunit
VSYAEVAERLAGGGPWRITGAGTKLGWGAPVEHPALSTTETLGSIVDHSAGDFTAVLQSGVRLADAQAAFAPHGQRLSLDPPGDGATIGGVVATGDSGPLRHRYGAPRDLVIGIALALPDGTVARAGGRVIKNVAGYDLAKLTAGAFGTLGLIAEVCVRLHPIPPATATALFRSGDPDRLARTALDLHGRPLELESLDVRFVEGDGAVLARFAGRAAAERAAATDLEVVEDDESLWDAQRAGQRSAGGVVLRIAALPTDLAKVLHLARERGATVVGRAGVGTAWLTLPSATPEAIAAIRREIGRPCTITDAPAELRAAIDPWDIRDGAELDLMRRVRDRFDPARICNGELMPT